MTFEKVSLMLFKTIAHKWGGLAINYINNLYRVYKKVDNFETALNLAKRLEVWSFLLMYIAWVLAV